MEVQKTVGDRKVSPHSSFTLQELANDFANIEKSIIDNGGEVTDDLMELHGIAKDLLAGKLDRVIRFKEALKAHIEACKEQIKQNQEMIDRIDQMVEQSVNAQADKQIHGRAYVAKVVKNPPSIQVVDEALVPLEYKVVKVSITDKFEATDAEKYRRYRDFLVGRSVTADAPMTQAERDLVEESIEVSVDKTRAKKAKVEIPGLVVVQETRVDVKSGKAKPPMLEAARGE